MGKVDLLYQIKMIVFLVKVSYASDLQSDIGQVHLLQRADMIGCACYSPGYSFILYQSRKRVGKASVCRVRLC